MDVLEDVKSDLVDIVNSSNAVYKEAILVPATRNRRPSSIILAETWERSEALAFTADGGTQRQDAMGRRRLDGSVLGRVYESSVS